MNKTEWTYTYGIHCWMILRSSYKKLAWVRLEHTATEFCSGALTEWSNRPCVQISLNFVQLHRFHLLLNVQISCWLLPLSVATFILLEVLQTHSHTRSHTQIYLLIHIYVYITYICTHIYINICIYI